jgi:hypothetical protein
VGALVLLEQGQVFAGGGQVFSLEAHEDLGAGAAIADTDDVCGSVARGVEVGQASLVRVRVLWMFGQSMRAEDQAIAEVGEGLSARA